MATAVIDGVEMDDSGYSDPCGVCGAEPGEPCRYEPSDDTYAADSARGCIGVEAGCCNQYVAHTYEECFTAEMMEAPRG